MNRSKHPSINSEQAAEYAARLAAQEQALAGNFPFIIKDERIFCTDSLWRLIGLASADGSAPLESWLARLEPGDRRTLQLAVAHAQQTGEDLTLDVRLARSGDAPRYFRLQARPEQNSPDSALAGFLVDVTNIRQACNDQIDRQAREIQALYEISRLLAQMVDLNTLLQQIAHSAAVLIQRDCRTVLHL
ncbi:MAG TPA: hypothetical protein VLS48_03400, partial [Anaerolineales bacterium]|nr:hypothetical protein [Anaerolineales bacterium]